MGNRWLTLAGVLLTVLVAANSSPLANGRSQQPGGGSATPVSEHQRVFDRYCVSCHNDQLKTAGLSLSALDVGRVGEHAEVWEKVAFKLRARFMPPAGRPLPDEA